MLSSPATLQADRSAERPSTIEWKVRDAAPGLSPYDPNDRRPMRPEAQKNTVILAVLLLSALLAACAPQKQAVREESIVARPLVTGDSVRARVMATSEDWLNSGVSVAAGQEYRIEAQGQWRTAGICNMTGPDGVGLYNMLCIKLPVFPTIVDGVTHSTLIGRIGQNGTPFAIGASLTFTARADGPLFLRMNDTPGAGFDNEGYVDVEIRVATATVAAAPKASAAAAAIAVPAVVAAKVAADPSLNRVALVIGNSSYAQSPLKNPANDANAMAETLRGLGFHVILKLDADQPAMEAAIDDFARRLLSGRHVALFYFAGHGVQVDGANYLIPTGAIIQRQSDVRYKAVNVGQVLGAMGEANDNLNIVILDACRDNPLPRSFRSTSRGLAQVEGPKGTIIAFATSPGSTAADGEGDHGVYTKHLLANIPAQGISVEQVFKRVLRGVDAETGGLQTPWTESSFTGDFSFNPH